MSGVASTALWAMFWGAEEGVFLFADTRCLLQRETNNVTKGGTPF